MKKPSFNDLVEEYSNPTIDWIISNGVEKLLNFNDLVSIINSAPTDYINVQKNLIKINYSLKNVYQDLKMREENYKQDLEEIYGEIAVDMKSDPLTAKLTKDILDSLIKSKPQYKEINQQLKEVLSCKQRLYGLIEVVNALIDTARDVVQNGIPSPTGRTMTDKEIERTADMIAKGFESVS